MPRITVPEGEHPLSFMIGEYAPQIGLAGQQWVTTVYRETRLPFRVLEAARIATAHINGCVTCKSWRSARDLPGALEAQGHDRTHSFVGRDPTAPGEDWYEAIQDWRGSTLFAPQERLAIELAERMGTAPQSFEGDEDFWTRMHAAYTDREITELTMAIGSFIGMGRVMHVLEVDPAVCPISPEAAEQALV